MKQSTLPEDIQNVHRCLQTGRSIYIGNLQSAQNLKTLKKYGIKAVVTVARGAFLHHSNKQLPNYLEEYSLDVHFDQTYNFVENNLKKTNVLVHCRAGISRSASVVIAYLMKKQQIPYKQAYDKISYWRSIIQPNKGFVVQLKKYQRFLNANSRKLSQQNKWRDPIVAQQQSVKRKTELPLLRIEDEGSENTLSNCKPLTTRARNIGIQKQLEEIQSNQMSLEEKIKELRLYFLETHKLHNNLKKEIDSKLWGEVSLDKPRKKISLEREKKTGRKSCVKGR